MTFDRRTLIVALGSSAVAATAARAGSAEDRKPFFRFHPYAYQLGALKPSTAPCEICTRPCVWQHDGPIYSRTEYGSVCASCIADGRLLRADPTMQLHDITLTRSDPALEREVLTRTPGVASFNPFEWPVIARTPMAFIGEGESPTFRGNEAVAAAIRDGWKAMDGEGKAPDHYALIFRELEGTRIKAIFDFD